MEYVKTLIISIYSTLGNSTILNQSSSDLIRDDCMNPHLSKETPSSDIHSQQTVQMS